MTMVSELDVSCTRCGRHDRVSQYQSANVSLDPSLKERVLALDLNWFSCPACRAGQVVSYDLLYHDMRRPLMIQLTARTDAAALPAVKLMKEYTLRVVTTPLELAEQVLIAHHGLNDMAVGLVKQSIRLTLLKQYENLLWSCDLVPTDPARVVFIDVSDLQEGRQLLFLLLADSDPACCPIWVHVPLAEYDQVRAAVEQGTSGQSPTGGWLRVDDVFLRQTYIGLPPTINANVLIIPGMVVRHERARPIWEKHIAGRPASRFRLHKKPWPWTRLKRLRQAYAELSGLSATKAS